MRWVASLCVSLGLLGCAANNPPPSATAVPYDPNLLTVSRQNAADRWAADVARRQYVSQYMNAICAADGPWSQLHAAWIAEERIIWQDVLWKFEPIPNTPKTANPDFGSILGAVLGLATKAAPLVLREAPPPLPPGLPPC